MSHPPEDENIPQDTTEAFEELRRNLDYARDLVRGGRLLERLQVSAFDVADLYRAAWVQTISSLDHWVHRELYDRAEAFAMQPALPRPRGYLRIDVPMSMFEEVYHGTASMREVFRVRLNEEYGWQSFQAPDKIKQALAVVTDKPLWQEVTSTLNRAGDNKPIRQEELRARLADIVSRRNRIAHEADRDRDHPGARGQITDTETAAIIDWIEQLASAILDVLGPPPATPRPAGDTLGPTEKHKWSRAEIDKAVAQLPDRHARDAAAHMLRHVDADDVMVRGGTSTDPSAGFYYWHLGHRRSLWSLYLSPDRPTLNLNLGSIAPRDADLVQQMIAELRRDPTLDAVLLQDDNQLARRYPAIPLTTLGASPQALATLTRAIDLAVHATKSTPQ